MNTTFVKMRYPAVAMHKLHSKLSIVTFQQLNVHIDALPFGTGFFISRYGSNFVFENKIFHKDHGWELKFADEYPNRQQILTKENLFIHIGQKSLIDINPKP